MTDTSGDISYVLGIGSSFPPYIYTQNQMRDAFLRNNPTTDIDFVHRVFKGTQNEECRSFLQEDDLFKRMSREDYISYIKRSLYILGIDAARKALQEWNGDISSITHIIWGSMTGCIYAPTLCTEFILGLKLSKYTKQLNIENMGCLTGYLAMSLASSISKENNRYRILVIVGDIRSSLGNQFTPHEENTPIDRSNVIAGALFRDSCGAVVIGSSIRDEVPVYSILNHESVIIPDTFSLVKYSEKNGGHIHLDISKDLPTAVTGELPSLIERLIQGYNIDISMCDISCHTGGPRILNGVRDSLYVSDEQMDASWYVLKKYGNLSGSSNIVVLDFNRNIEINPHHREYCICISMGPGVTVQTLLLKRE